MKHKNITKLKDIILCISLFLISVGMAFYPAKISSAVKDSVMRCLNILIPSLFAFMAASSMLVNSGCLRILTKPFKWIPLVFFRMPEGIFTVFLISTFAGYPVGIKTLSDMLDSGEIDAETAEKSACFCYCGGPAFYSGAIGLTVFGSKDVGLLIFLSVLLSNIVIAFIVCRTSELKENRIVYEKRNGDLLVGSITLAGKSMGVICMTVIFFSAVTALLEAGGILDFLQHIFGLSDNETVMLSAFMEITSLSELHGSPYRLLPFICAVCSFGGLCIIIQLFALKSEKLSMFSFIKHRPLAALLSAVLCKILQPHLISETVTAVSYNHNLVKVNNLSASLCLIFMIFLLNYKKGLVFSDRV